MKDLRVVDRDKFYEEMANRGAVRGYVDCSCDGWIDEEYEDADGQKAGWIRTYDCNDECVYVVIYE